MNEYKNVILTGDALEWLRQLPDNSINTCVTSPPYWGLRDYGVAGQIGLEKTPEEYVDKLVEVFREVKRVLRDDGTLWLNLGDSYYNYRLGKGQTLVKQTVSKTKQDLSDTCPRRGNKLVGLKEKDLVGIPWRVAFALQADGWYLRSDIIWHKPNAMPESVKDRPTKAHEYIFLLAKSEKYYYDYESIKEPAINAGKTVKTNGADGMVGGYDGYRTRDGFKRGITVKEKKNKRTVWSITTKPFKETHFAVFPPDLIEPCVLAGCPEGGIVLDPFFGAGTTGLVARRHNRNFIGIELNPQYVEIAKNRIKREFPSFTIDVRKRDVVSVSGMGADENE